MAALEDSATTTLRLVDEYGRPVDENGYYVGAGGSGGGHGYTITDDRRGKTLLMSWDMYDALREGMAMAGLMHAIVSSSSYPTGQKPAGTRARKRWKRRRAAGRG